MSSAAAFRHDPVKSVLPGKSAGPVLWAHEPAVCGYRRLSYENTRLERTIPVPISASPAIIAGVGVLIASDDGYLRFFDRTLRKVYWERRLGSAIYASLILDAKRRRVIVAATSGLVACFDLRGKLVWSEETGTPVFATPTILSGSDVLIIAAFQSRCIGLRLERGDRIFDRRLPEPWHVSLSGSAAHRDPYASPATTAEDTAIICCAEHILCIAADGAELWRHETGHAIKASPAALHDVAQVAVCPVDGRCLFLDSQTGDLCGEVFLGAKITASPAVSGNILAVGTQCDTVAGLDIGTRQIVWTSSQGAPRAYTSFSVLPNGSFISTSARGNILCLQRDNGRFLWESSQVLGLPDHDPTMDITPVTGPDGSMYCASYSGVIYYFRFQPSDSEVPSCP